MLAELRTFPSSGKKMLKSNCYVSSYSLKLDAMLQLVKNIKIINFLFFIVSIVSSKINMLTNSGRLNGAVAK